MHQDIIHRGCHEMDLGSLRNVSLRQISRIGNANDFVWGVLSLREECDLIKERDKQKREAMCNFHYKILLWMFLKAVKMN